MARACLVSFDVGQLYIRCASADEPDEARHTLMMRQGRWHVAASSPQPADLTFIQVNPGCLPSCSCGAKLWLPTGSPPLSQVTLISTGLPADISHGSMQQIPSWHRQCAGA